MCRDAPTLCDPVYDVRDQNCITLEYFKDEASARSNAASRAELSPGCTFRVCRTIASYKKIRSQPVPKEWELWEYREKKNDGQAPL